jgi:glucoamylase
MFGLMLRNVATSDWVLQDGLNRRSQPGCIIAASSYPASAPGALQDYVHHWTRDAAIVAMELAEAEAAALMENYVSFARVTQDETAAHDKPFDWACFHIDGSPREDWTAQGDGPALQTLAVLRGWHLLGSEARESALLVIHKNLEFLLAHCRDMTTNLWEKTYGHSLFTRSVQLKCFNEVVANAERLKLNSETQVSLSEAQFQLSRAIQEHFAPSEGRYRSVPDAPNANGWDLNSDAVMASVYGAIPCTDGKLLATAAQVRAAFADSSSPWYYPVNGQDGATGVGPLIGRYPMDTYDGRFGEHNTPGGHPWAPCTCNFAELYYRLAKVHRAGVDVVREHASPFYAQVGIGRDTAPAEAAGLLKDAGDRMLRAIMRHSDHLELSEQFDGNTGLQLSIRNLTWSYAAYISAVRARKQI